jgi:hypothetical protein
MLQGKAGVGEQYVPAPQSASIRQFPGTQPFPEPNV